MHPLAQIARGLEQVEHRERGGDDGWSDRVAEQVRARTLLEQLDDLGAGGDVPAGSSTECFAECAGDDVDAVAYAEQLRCAAAARADEADRVRVVDHDEGVVAIGECADLVERGEIAVHREHTVGDDEAVAGIACLDEPGLELGHVAVGVAKPLRLAQAYAVDDRGVVEGIADDGVAFVQKRLEDAAVGVEAGAEQHCVLRAEERREPQLEVAVDRLRAADEAHGGHAVAPRIEGVVRRSDHARIVSEAEVVVGAQVEDVSACGVGHVGALR